ncbi:MAG: AAA family ATPase [Gammaproteobacteria bacterium]|nr:AAA family ATPase [Gammaproteobacteria bacterium]
MHDLAVILASRVPIVAVETHEEGRFLGLLEDMSRGAFGGDTRPLFRWTVTDGLQRLDRDLGVQAHNADPTNVLKHVRAVDEPGLYVLLDFHPYLSDPVHQRLLKDIAVQSTDGRRTVILVGHDLELPPDLERLSARFEMQLPDDNERAMLVARVVENWNQANRGNANIDQQAFDQLVSNLAGLTRGDIERLARAAVHNDGALTACDVPEVMQAKYELLNRDGLLSFEYDLAQFADIGGLRKLKHWLEQRRAVLADPPASLEPPKGLLLIGVQGCGKSLAARATAGVLGRPLLRLDFGSLYNKYHGESEKNLRGALRQAELMAPCVLWIDEIEKGLATGDGDSGTSRRVLGTFLTWLAEQAGKAFVVATANDISALPPELIRKGRFDEIFFVDLPDTRSRAEILIIQLKKRDLEPKSFDLAKLVQASDGFSGAELEQGVVAALYTAHAAGREPDTGLLLAEFMRTRPLSVVMAEKVQGLRAWAANRCVPAD